jgi:GDP-L-fucose synthase
VIVDLTEKRILLTGGGGFLGSHLQRALREAGAKQVFAPRRAEFDLTRSVDIERLFDRLQPQVLIHAAAVVGGIGANSAEPGRFFYENAIMGVQLIEAARRYSVEKTVVMGTICAYPKFTPIPFSEDDLWNGYPEETNAPYGLAKKALLVQCQSYRQQYGMNAIFLLLVNLYGPGDNFDPHSSHVIPALIRKCLEARASGAKEIALWGDGTPTREFLYVTDATRGILLATQQYDGAGPVNLGSGHEISIRDLAESIGRLTGFTGALRWDASKPNGQPRRSLDVRRAESEFGFRAAMELENGLAQTIHWYSTSLTNPHC